MHNNSWSLVFFTLLSQFATGLMIFFTVMYFTNPSSWQLFDKGFCIKSPDFVALILLAIAVLFSFFHLGKKLHAINAMSHLSSSWLSREIFAVLLFGGSVLLVFLLRIFSPNAGWLIPASLILSSLAGIFLIVVISKVYLIKTIPPWNTWHTPVGFFLSAISLGASGIILIYMLHYAGPETNSVLTKFTNQILWALALALAIEIIISFIFQTKLAKESPAGIEQLSFTSGTYHSLKLVRIFILFVTLVFTIYFSVRLPGIENNFQAHLRFFTMIFAMVITQEIIGRYMFYASYYRVGV